MAEKSRETLKESFKVGSTPTRQDYIDIVDSSINEAENNFIDTTPSLPDAIISQKGIVEQATLAEVEDDNTRFLTPKETKRATKIFSPETTVKSFTGK